MPLNKYYFIVDNVSIRLDQFLVQRLPDYSRSKIQNYIKKGQVWINGQIGRPSLKLHKNDKIQCKFVADSNPEHIKSQNIGLDIIYEDEHLAIINKPAGLVVHPGCGNPDGTLLNGLINHFQNLSKENTTRPGIIHRLDKDTSGLIVIAKNDYSHENISKQFFNRTIQKEYKAIVWGKVDQSGSIKLSIDRNPRNRKTFCTVNSGGKNAYTSYEVINYYPPFSLLSLYPKTGRTHQIRVHLKSINHPIICDNMYGGGIKNLKAYHISYKNISTMALNSISRLALHSSKIKFCHPETLEMVEYQAPLPADFVDLIKVLKNAK